MGRIGFHEAWLGLLLVSALAGCLIKLGVLKGRFRWYQFRYFTTLSNLLCVLYARYALLRGVSPRFQGMTLVSLVVTGVIYHLLLTGVFGGKDRFTQAWWGNQLVHTVTPLLMVGEWLLFREAGAFGWRDPLEWLLFPLAYMVLTLVMGRVGSLFPHSNTPYPYPFLDVWKLGWGPVLGNAASIAAAFVALGYGLVALDRLMI